MTHDELLNRIKEGQWVDRQEMILRSNALRAVVELHKPFDLAEYVKPQHTVPSKLVCQFCGARGIMAHYPCPTIQAIEKELA